MAASTVGPISGDDPAALAQTCVGGGRDVRTTVLDEALVGAAVANKVSAMQPYVVALRRGGHDSYRLQPAELRRFMSVFTAEDLTKVMEAGVRDGPARAAAVPGATTGGLATTVSGAGGPSLGWFVGYVSRDGRPVAATAVCVQDPAAGAFGEPERWRFDWDVTYTRDQWLEQVPTFGGHAQLPPRKLAEVLAGIAAVDALGGTLPTHYTTLVVTAARSDGWPARRRSVQED